MQHLIEDILDSDSSLSKTIGHLGSPPLPFMALTGLASLVGGAVNGHGHSSPIELMDPWFTAPMIANLGLFAFNNVDMAATYARSIGEQYLRGRTIATKSVKGGFLGGLVDLVEMGVGYGIGYATSFVF